MLHVAIKYRTEKIPVRELKCHRQKHQTQSRQSCIVSWRAFHGWASHFVPMMIPYRTRTKTESHAQNEREHRLIDMGKGCLTSDTSTWAHFIKPSSGIWEYWNCFRDQPWISNPPKAPHPCGHFIFPVMDLICVYRLYISFIDSLLAS